MSPNCQQPEPSSRAEILQKQTAISPKPDQIRVLWSCSSARAAWRQLPWCSSQGCSPLCAQCFWFSHLCYTEMPAAALCGQQKGQKAAKPKEFHCWPGSQQRGQPQAMLSCALSSHTDSTSWGEKGKNPGFENILCLGSVNY